MDKISKITELVEELNKYAYEYYVLDNPSISDKQYDAKYDDLFQLEKEVGIILPNSPTQRVGDTVLSGFEKVTHVNKLWSLDKAQDKETVQGYVNRCNKVVEEYNRAHSDKLPKPKYILTKKFDGLTIDCVYDENGDFERGATRGTGEVGENVTENCKTILNLPKHIENDFRINVHGEALMSRNAFKEYNNNLKSNETPLKNLRNGASGALRNLNVNETARRKLICQIYDLSYSEKQFDTYIDTLEFMREKGFTVADYVVCDSFEDISKAIDDIGTVRDSLQYDIDGVVIAIDDLKTREVLGYTIKFPKYAIAYKFEAEETTTKLIGVDWNVGRTGKVVPTGLLEPVELCGVTVKRATLNNIDDIRRKGVKLNSEVFIRRSNDVIPEVLGVVEESLNNDDIRDIEVPKTCPSCGNELIQDGVHYFCRNSEGCKPQLVKPLAHFCSREAMNITGFSEKTAELFVDHHIVGNIVDLYKLEEKKEEVVNLPKFGVKKYENLIENVNKSTQCKLNQLVYGLGIDNVGKKTASDLANKFKTLDKLQNATINELVEIEDIGGIVANSVYNYFNNDKNKELLNELLGYIQIQEEIKKDVSNIQYSPLKNRRVYPTGTFNLKKNALKEKLESAGAIIASGYAKSLDWLIVGSVKGSSKSSKAEDDGVPIMTEDEMMQYL